MTSMVLLSVALLMGAHSILAAQDQHAAAREELKQGVKAYKAADYGEAIRHFENAVRADPDLTIGRLYLATAYAQEYLPGVETPENLALATKAIDQYKQVLRLDPLDITAMKGVAFLNMQLKRLDEARAAYKKGIEIEPNDPKLYLLSRCR